MEWAAKSGLSDSEIARRLGISPASFCAYRTKKTQPCLDTAILIVEELTEGAVYYTDLLVKKDRRKKGEELDISSL
jgi:transcriptional regulator with XRE-family HTH domain